MVVTEMECGYRVLSPSGNTYLVTEQSARYHYEYDQEYMQVWSCTCPAGKYGKNCKHVAAVLQHRAEK